MYRNLYELIPRTPLHVTHEDALLTRRSLVLTTCTVTFYHNLILFQNWLVRHAKTTKKCGIRLFVVETKLFAGNVEIFAAKRPPCEISHVKSPGRAAAMSSRIATPLDSRQPLGLLAESNTVGGRNVCRVWISSTEDRYVGAATDTGRYVFPGL